jgi:hypothetical protein
MNVNKKGIITISVCFFLMLTVRAQTSLTVYPLNGVVGVKFFSDNKISFEPRIDFQFDFVNGETNMFINPEFFTMVNFLKEEKFNMYTGLGLGANIYNQAQSNFSGSLPLGAAYYLDTDKRLAIISECGFKITAADFLKLRSYVLVGIQVRLK